MVRDSLTVTGTGAPPGRISVVITGVAGVWRVPTS
jgi:uncharacterized membrane protein YuzA (DUF378 family)